MKKVLLSGVLFSFLAVSCGPSVCDCVKLDKERFEAEDMDKFKEDNKSKMEACEKIIEDMGLEKAMEEAKKCK